jgi:hypothetical protein
VGLGSWSNSSPILWCLSKASTNDGSFGERIKEIWQSPTSIMSTEHWCLKLGNTILILEWDQ